MNGKSACLIAKDAVCDGCQLNLVLFVLSHAQPDISLKSTAVLENAICTASA